MNVKTSILATGVLMATLIAISPAAMAESNGKYKHGGMRDKQEMCENFREGQGPLNREERQREMQQYRAEMADRLKLTEEQREIWQEIHQERQQKHQQRMDQWQEKMEQRCGEKGKNRK